MGRLDVLCNADVISCYSADGLLDEGVSEVELGARFFKGTTNQKVLPCPGVLSTPISPPMS